MSSVLVAVTVALAGEAGAVKSPGGMTVPALAVHVAVVLKDPVPGTVALHCEVALTPTVDGVQATATEVIVDEVD